MERYIYRLLTPMLLFFVQKPLSRWQAQCKRLRMQLAKVGWISQGYVQDRGPGAGAPHYQWTRKLKAKTVSVALSKEQYQWLREAIANWRQLQKTLAQMQQLSRKVLFQTLPHPKRRKPLSQRVLGIN